MAYYPRSQSAVADESKQYSKHSSHPHLVCTSTNKGRKKRSDAFMLVLSSVSALILFCTDKFLLILSVITFLTCECCHPPQAGFPMSTNAIKQSPLSVPRGPLSGHSKLCKVERTHHHNIHLQKKKKKRKH